jgi:hypothetical protein
VSYLFFHFFSLYLTAARMEGSQDPRFQAYEAARLRCCAAQHAEDRHAEQRELACIAAIREGTKKGDRFRVKAEQLKAYLDKAEEQAAPPPPVTPQHTAAPAPSEVLSSGQYCQRRVALSTDVELAQQRVQNELLVQSQLESQRAAAAQEEAATSDAVRYGQEAGCKPPDPH